MINDHIMEGDRARDAPRLRNGSAARAVPKRGIVVIWVDRAPPPVAAAGGAEEVGLPVRGVDG